MKSFAKMLEPHLKIAFGNMKAKSLSEAALNLSTELHELEAMLMGKGIEFPEKFDKAWEELTYWLEKKE